MRKFLSSLLVVTLLAAATSALAAPTQTIDSTGNVVAATATRAGAVVVAGTGRCTVVLGTGAIAAGATATQDVSCAGAAVNAGCIVGGPATLEAGLLQTCYVSAAGTITLRTGNNTAGGITPAAAQTVAVRFINP